MSRIASVLLRDLVIIIFSIIVAISLVRTGAISTLLTSIQDFETVGAFIAGIFFTSIFTTAAAIVTLGEIAQTSSVVGTAFFGAFGALIGDLIIFRFIRDRFSEHLLEALKHQRGIHKMGHFFRRKYFRWLTFLVGGAIIASPLPDELGIALVGFSKMKILGFMALSLVFNFTGIVFIGLVARSL